MSIAEQRAKDLGEKPIEDLLLKFSIPAIVGMMVQALYNVVDQIFVGQYIGDLALGGLAIVGPMMFIQFAFSMLIGLGGNSLVSIRLGQQRKEESDNIAGNTLGYCFIFGFTLAVVTFILLDEIPTLFGATENNYQYARDYLGIILLGFPFQSVSAGMNNYIRSEGNPKKAMSTMLIGAITNTILDFVFIAVLNWGVKGAALATIISQVVSMTWVLSYFFRRQSFLVITKDTMKLKLSILSEIVKYGFAPFGMQLTMSLVTVIFNKSLHHYGGDAAISSMGILSSVSGLIMMPVFGMNQGAQPIMGYNFGAQKYDRVKKALFYSCIAATIVTTIGFIICQAFPVQLFHIYLSDNERFHEFLKVGVPAMRIYNSLFFMVGGPVIFSGYFQATGRPKIAITLSLTRQLIFLLPAIAILPRFFGLTGVWLAMPVSDMLAAIVSVVTTFKDLKKWV